MLEIVAREHDQRPLCRKLLLEKILPYPAGPLSNLPVAQRAPPGAVALREKQPPGCVRRPEVQALGELARVRTERVRRAQQHAAVSAPLDEDVARAEAHGPGRSGHDDSLRIPDPREERDAPSPLYSGPRCGGSRCRSFT